MRISVVTISFNQARFLRQCIDSVLNQDYADIEYIIVDPGSTDGSREIIDSYGDRVIRIYENDHGPADGLNKGFARATGQVFCFINSDDFLLPSALNTISQYFDNNPSTDVVLAAGLQVNEQGIQVLSFYPSKVSKSKYVYGAVTFFQQGLFFKSSLFKEIGGFNVDNRISWDGELLLNFMLVDAHIHRIMNKVGAFRIYPESITGSKRFSLEFSDERQRMFQIVFGHDSIPNIFIIFLYKLIKLLGDPLYLYMRTFRRYS
jgi:glycosyltransferase involved in cell wall biosynthesis